VNSLAICCPLYSKASDGHPNMPKSVQTGGALYIKNAISNISSLFHAIDYSH
jgi:hypothetical protein